MAAIVIGRTARAQRGSSLVEFAMVLPLLLLVFAGIVDFGFLFQRYEVITNAAREGARIAVLPGYGTADIQARVMAYVAEGLGDWAVQDNRTQVAGPETVEVVPGGGARFNAARVTVTFRNDYLLIGFMVNLATGGGFAPDITLHAVSTMRIEAGS